MSNILVLSIAISYEDAPLKHIQSFHLKSFHHGQTFKICNNQSEFRELWPESSCSKTLFLLINELSLCKVKQTMWVLMVMSQDHRWKGALIVLTSFLLLKSNKMINLSSHYLTNSRNEKKKKKSLLSSWSTVHSSQGGIHQYPSLTVNIISILLTLC